MVAINEIPLPECADEGCGGDTDICTDSRIHHRNAENRVPTTRSHRRTRPLVSNLYQGMSLDAVTGLCYERFRNYSPTLGTWRSQDPLGFINGANTYQFVNSSPVGSLDAEGLAVTIKAIKVLARAGRLSLGFRSGTGRICSASLFFGGKKIASAQIPVGGWGAGEHQIPFNGRDLLGANAVGGLASDPGSLVLKTNLGNDSAPVNIASKPKKLRFTGDVSSVNADGGPEEGWGLLGAPTYALLLSGWITYHRVSVLAASALNVDFIGPSDKYTLGGVSERGSRIKSIETSISGVGGWKAWTPAQGWLAKPRELITSGKHVGYYWFNSAQITASLVAALGEDGPMLVNPVISAAGQGNYEKVAF
jgi:RHS repeat-associated protein